MKRLTYATKTPSGQRDIPSLRMIDSWKAQGAPKCSTDKIYYILKKLSLALSLMSRPCRRCALTHYLLGYELADSTFYVPVLNSSLSTKAQESTLI